MQLTVLAQPVVNVTKSCNKLGLHIPNLPVTKETSRVVRITIQSDSGTASFLAKASEWICIPSRIRSTLGIMNGQRLRVVELETIQPHTPRPLAIVGDKVDMLSLIPETTNRGYQLYVDEYESEEPRLRIWYCHRRGAAHQLELKRNVGVSVIGGLLGQLQAEGDKKSLRVLFKNSAISERADFVGALRELDLPSTNILSRCIFNPNKASHGTVRKYSASYKKATGIRISSVRLRIVDRNQAYLEDYAAILAEEGFKAKINPEDISVRAYCTWLNLVTLYRIGAFKNGRNWVKLLCSMKIALEGRETRGYKRIQEFAKLKAVTSYDVCAKYGIGSRAANLWLVNMSRLGLIKRSTDAQPNRYIRYVLTVYGRMISRLLDAMERDYQEISRNNKCDARQILEKIKVRTLKSPTSTK